MKLKSAFATLFLTTIYVAPILAPFAMVGCGSCECEGDDIK